MWLIFFQKCSNYCSWHLFYCKCKNNLVIWSVSSYLWWLLYFHMPTGINWSVLNFRDCLIIYRSNFLHFSPWCVIVNGVISLFSSKAVQKIHSLLIFYSWHCMCFHSWSPGTFCRQPRHVVTGEFWLKIIFSGERNAKRRVRLWKMLDVMVKVLPS